MWVSWIALVVAGGLSYFWLAKESLRAKPFSRMASPPISGDILVLTLAQRLLGGFKAYRNCPLPSPNNLSPDSTEQLGT
jgi:hypothetical protein